MKIARIAAPAAPGIGVEIFLRNLECYLSGRSLENEA